MDSISRVPLFHKDTCRSLPSERTTTCPVPARPATRRTTRPRRRRGPGRTAPRPRAAGRGRRRRPRVARRHRDAGGPRRARPDHLAPAALPARRLRRAWLVQAVTDDAKVNGDVVAEADAARIWAVRADDAESSWTPASGHAGDATVGVLLGGDPRRAAASATPWWRAPRRRPGIPALPAQARRRRARRRRPRRPRPDHRARAAAARHGRRRRHRPARPRRPAGRAGRRRRGDRRRQDPLRADGHPGPHQRVPGRAREGGPVRRPAEGRRPVRVRARRRGGPALRPARRPGHGRPRHHQRGRRAVRRGHPGHPPGRVAGVPRRLRARPAGTPTRPSTGRRWAPRTARSSCSWRWSGWRSSHPPSCAMVDRPTRRWPWYRTARSPASGR